MMEVESDIHTVVVTRTPWMFDGVAPQLWGRSHLATGPDGRTHAAPGFWRLWWRLRREYGDRVRVSIAVVDVDRPQRGLSRRRNSGCGGKIKKQRKESA